MLQRAGTRAHTPAAAKAPPVTRERPLITFANNLIFPGSPDAALQGEALSFTNNHLNRATKETQVLPKPQLMRERGYKRLCLTLVETA